MEYPANLTVMRAVPGVAVIQQDGMYARVNDQVACCIITADEVMTNPRHYVRNRYPEVFSRMQDGETAAMVLCRIQGKPAQALLTPEQFALGAPERARYAAWADGGMAREAARVAAERAHDQGANEGGEGYNPHRDGSERTYARTPGRERDYPQDA